MLGRLLSALTLSVLLLTAANPKVAEANAKVKAGEYDAAIAILDPLHKANPKDAEVTSALANAHLKYGDSYFNNAALPPRQKYRPALLQYRQTLALDPQNKDAEGKVRIIESIYQQMGLPIPK